MMPLVAPLRASCEELCYRSGPMQGSNAASNSLSFAADFDPVEAVRLQRLGRLDPTMVLGEREVFRATHTPQGPATVHVRWSGARIEARAWGDGAPWALSRVPAFCGAEDDVSTFTPHEPWLVDIARRHHHVRLGRSLRLFDTLVSYILQQRVKFMDAAASWRRLVGRYGQPAPGPQKLLLPLTPQQWRSLPAPVITAADVDPQRARFIREAALHGRKLDGLDDAPLEDARALLPKLEGIGPWTSAMTLAVGSADPDAVPVGDSNIHDAVGRAFTGQLRTSDAGMLKLLEPYRGHRFRVIRLLFAAGIRQQRLGPRLPRSRGRHLR